MTEIFARLVKLCIVLPRTKICLVTVYFTRVHGRSLFIHLGIVSTDVSNLYFSVQPIPNYICLRPLARVCVVYVVKEFTSFRISGARWVWRVKERALKLYSCVAYVETGTNQGRSTGGGGGGGGGVAPPNIFLF